MHNKTKKGIGKKEKKKKRENAVMGEDQEDKHMCRRRTGYQGLVLQGSGASVVQDSAL